ncbi:MAG: GlsB/YeaQ/YmgE family stress response membrane protein [Anaerolineae bacterium]|uniref:GlsB/YeaQ/YmgE family stress response membrane protein n=1 Tax=Promineifilum sp. TaxID=2664178 RepID=UPI001D27E1B2|nr:GlsB/YeaQ/YmgE family stress response membrane protein [Anaerolineales bacterium]MCB8934310.1 GlsB/YeaQ/YmgE family stress response membrane protein [Promineifilum sp.]MCW5846769.1 GlsB/YeaQ/YmgE family stress response membrane protein [Anaerolineae bacterium]
MGLLGWLIGGGIIGWIASMITGRNAQQGLIGNILAGIIGAFVGGAIYGALFGNGISFEWNLTSFIVALIGAVIVLAIWNFISRRA